MGWLIDIYLLENIFIISILKFFRIGILHSNKDKIYGIILGIYKFDIRLTIGKLEIPKIEGVEANA